MLPEVLLRSSVLLSERIFGLGCAREQVLLHFSHSLHCVGQRAWSLKKTLGAQDRVIILCYRALSFRAKILILIIIYLTFIMSDIRRLYSHLLFLVLLRKCLHIFWFAFLNGRDLEWFF